MSYPKISILEYIGLIKFILLKPKIVQVFIYNNLVVNKLLVKILFWPKNLRTINYKSIRTKMY